MRLILKCIELRETGVAAGNAFLVGEVLYLRKESSDYKCNSRDKYDKTLLQIFQKSYRAKFFSQFYFNDIDELKKYLLKNHPRLRNRIQTIIYHVCMRKTKGKIRLKNPILRQFDSTIRLSPSIRLPGGAVIVPNGIDVAVNADEFNEIKNTIENI